MIDRAFPEISAEFRDEFHRAFRVFKPRDRRFEIARICQTVRADRSEIGQAKLRAVIFADVAARVAVGQLDAEFQTARNHANFARFYFNNSEFGQKADAVSLRDDETVVQLVCRAELIGADRPRHGDPRPALRQAYGEMGWEVPELLDAMDASDDVYFDRVSQIHLPHWSANRVALVGDAAACPSLLAGEGTGLGMLEAYVLAGELHRADGDCTRALAAYESRLQRFVSAKQKGAFWFRGFFAPQTALGLMVRSLAVHAFSLPWLGKPFWERSLHDDFTLPEYQMS